MFVDYCVINSNVNCHLSDVDIQSNLCILPVRVSTPAPGMEVMVTISLSDVGIHSQCKFVLPKPIKHLYVIHVLLVTFREY